MVSNFTRAQVSLPGNERVAMTPFGAKLVIHALKSETDGSFGIWDTFTPPGRVQHHIHTPVRQNCSGSCRAHTDFGAAIRSSMRRPARSWFCRPTLSTPGATSAKRWARCSEL